MPSASSAPSRATASSSCSTATRPAARAPRSRRAAPAAWTASPFLRVAPYRLEDGRLAIRETTEHRFNRGDQTSRRTVIVEARLEDDALRGTASAVEHFDGPVWGAYARASGAVAFSARPAG